MAGPRDGIIQWLDTNKAKIQKSWQNFNHTQKQDDALVVDVNTEKDLIKLVKKINKANSGLDDDAQIKLRASAGWTNTTLLQQTQQPQQLPQQQPSHSWSGLYKSFSNKIAKVRSSWHAFFHSNQVTPIQQPMQELTPAAGWGNVQSNDYNESYSLSGVVVGPGSGDKNIIVRFSPTFQTRVKVEDTNEQDLICPSGVQVREALDVTAKKGRTLNTESMIAYVSLNGLICTGGHGTGFEVPGVAGLVKEFTMIDSAGNMLRVSEDKIILQEFDDDGIKVGPEIELHEINIPADQIVESTDPKIPTKTTMSAKELFETIRGANLGLFGIITETRLQTIENYAVGEKRTVYNNADDLFKDLPPNLLFKGKNKNGTDFDGLCIMGMVTEPGHPMWEVRRWKRYKLDKIDPNQPPYYSPQNAQSFWQHVETVMGSKFLNAMLNLNAGKFLRKLYCRIAAAFAIGRKPIYDDDKLEEKFGEARKMEHYQVGFPKGVPLHDVSMIVPINIDEMEEKIPKILKYADQLAREYWANDETPVMFAYYLRILEGTQGGLSVTSHKPGQKMLAFEFVTHPEAPGLDKFQAQLVKFVEETVGPVKGHPGKEMPVPGRSFKDEFPAETINQVTTAMNAVADLAQPPAKNNGKRYRPFLTDYLSQMLGLKPMPKAVHTMVKTSQLSDAQAKADIAAGAKNLSRLMKEDMFGSEELNALNSEFKNISNSNSNASKKVA